MIDRGRNRRIDIQERPIAAVKIHDGSRDSFNIKGKKITQAAVSSNHNRHKNADEDVDLGSLVADDDDYAHSPKSRKVRRSIADVDTVKNYLLKNVATKDTTRALQPHKDQQSDVRCYQCIGKTLPNLDYFSYHNNLVMIELTKCNLFNNDVKPLGHCDQLRFISLTENYLTEIPDFFSSLINLQFLNLQQNCISKTNGLKPISALKCLSYLRIANNPVCDLADYTLQILTMNSGILAIDDYLVTYQMERYLFYQGKHLNHHVKSSSQKSIVARMSVPTAAHKLIAFIDPVIYSYCTPGRLFLSTSDLIMDTKVNILIKKTKKISPAHRIHRFISYCCQWQKFIAKRPFVVKIQSMVRSFLFHRKLAREMEAILSEFDKNDDNKLITSLFTPSVTSNRKLLKQIFFVNTIKSKWKRYKHNCRLYYAAATIQRWLRSKIIQRKIIIDRLFNTCSSRIIISSAHASVFQEAYDIILAQVTDNDTESDSEKTHEADVIVETIAEYRLVRDDIFWPLFKKINPPISTKEVKRLSIQRVIEFSSAEEISILRKIRRRNCVSTIYRAFTMIANNHHGSNTSPRNKESYGSTIFSITFCHWKTLLAVWKACVARKIPLYNMRHLLTTSAAISIQSCWRGFDCRKHSFKYCVSHLIQRRAILVIQRWWRMENGLKRRFRLLHDLLQRYRSIDTNNLYIDSWLYYVLLKQASLPWLPPMFQNLYPEFSGIPFVNRNFSACFAPTTNEHGSTDRDNQHFSAVNLSDEGSISSIALASAARTGLPRWGPWTIASEVTNESTTTSWIHEPAPVITSRTSPQYAIFELLTNNIDVSVVTAVIHSHQLTTRRDNISTSQLNYRLIKIHFQSIAEARIRAVYLMIATYDCIKHRGIVLYTEQELFTVHKINPACLISSDGLSSSAMPSLSRDNVAAPIESLSSLISTLPSWINISSTYQNINDFVRFHFMCESLLFNERPPAHAPPGMNMTTSYDANEALMHNPSNDDNDSVMRNNKLLDNFSHFTQDGPSILEMPSIDSALVAFMAPAPAVPYNNHLQGPGEQFESFGMMMRVQGIPLQATASLESPRHAYTATHASRSPRGYEYEPDLQRPFTTVDRVVSLQEEHTALLGQTPLEYYALLQNDQQIWDNQKVLLWCSRADSNVHNSTRPKTMGGMLIPQSSILGPPEQAAMLRLETIKSAREAKRVQSANAERLQHSRQGGRLRGLAGFINGPFENAVTRGSKAHKDFLEEHKREVDAFKQQKKALEAAVNEINEYQDQKRSHIVTSRMEARDESHISWLKKKLQHAQDANLAREKDLALQQELRQKNDEKRLLDVTRAKETAALEKSIQAQHQADRQWTVTHAGTLLTLNRRITKAQQKAVKERLHQENLSRYQQATAKRHIFTPRVQFMTSCGSDASSEPDAEVNNNNMTIDGDRIRVVPVDAESFQRQKLQGSRPSSSASRWVSDLTTEAVTSQLPPPSSNSRPKSAGIRYQINNGCIIGQGGHSNQSNHDGSVLEDLSKPSSCMYPGVERGYQFSIELDDEDSINNGDVVTSRPPNMNVTVGHAAANSYAELSSNAKV